MWRLEAPLTSDTFKKFRALPLAKLRAQQEMFLQQEFMNLCFYGDIINENQRSPPTTSCRWCTISRPGHPGGVQVQYAGCRTQLNLAGRVSDKQNAALSMDDPGDVCHPQALPETPGSGSVDRLDAMTTGSPRRASAT